MGTLKSSLSSGLAKGQKAAEKQKRKGQQTAGGGKKSAAAYSAAPAKRHAEEPETVKSESTPVYTASKKSSSANAAVASSMHYSSSGSRHSGSHGSLGRLSTYEQRRQQRDEARADFWNHTLDLLGTASAQAGRGITGISVPVEQQREESRRQIENINATKESRKRLQQLHELGYVPPRYEDLTTAQNAVDRFLGDRTQITGEKTNWGKLIQGVLYKGSDQAVTSIANAADMLFGGLSEELHTLGAESINAALDMVNVIPGVALDYVEPLMEGSALRWSAQKLRDLQQQNQAYFAPNANSSRAAQIIDRFGTSFVAALPMALEAYLLAPAAAGQGMTTQGLNYLSGVSRASGLNALGQMGAEGSRKLLSDPQFWTSYVHAAGGSYQNALEDGISEDDAALYALINGYYNALIEIGGADASLGGINRLPGRLRNIVQRGSESVAVQWLKSILGEMDEEIGQGIIGRGLKAFAGKSVPLVSLDPADHDAIFNPYAALEEGVGGGVNAFLLGSLQSGAALAGQSVSQPSNVPAQQAVYSVNEADYLDLLERKGLLPPESNKNAAPDGTAGNQTLFARVKNKLAGAIGRERASIIRAMSFGEQVAGIESGLISRQEQPFATVRDTTPDVLIQKAGAEQLPIIMSYETAYLSSREDGPQPGHYHSLGAELMAQIPEALEHPLTMVRQKNGRIVEVLDLKDSKGRSVCAVIELSAIKDFEGEYLAYNLMVTAYGAKENYIRNMLDKHENTLIK